MKTGDKCNKTRCLKETNHEELPGHFLGTPFVYEEFWLSCYFCTEGEKECEDDPTKKEGLIF